MAARTSTIRDWFEKGVEQGKTHMVVYCDTFDWEDFPVYCESAEAARKLHAAPNANMETIEEIYNLSGNMEEQLATRNCFEF